MDHPESPVGMRIRVVCLHQQLVVPLLQFDRDLRGFEPLVMTHGRDLLAVEPYNGPIVDRKPKRRLSIGVAVDARSGVRTTSQTDERPAAGAILGTIEK